MQIVYFLLALGGGALSTMQAAVNSQLRTYVGPLWTVCISLIVSVIFTLLALLCLRQSLPARAVFASAPLWVWTGGLFGIIFVLAGTVLPPKLGAGAFTAAVIAGQIVCSFVLDQFGLIGFEKHPLNWQRFLGIILLAAGVAMIRRF